MNDTLTCDIVEEHDLVAKYVAGRLTNVEAERLEAHCLECEACWADLRLAMKVHDATLPAFDSPASTSRMSARAVPWWRGTRLAWAAAAVVVIAVGSGWMYQRQQRQVEVERGSPLNSDLRVTSDGSHLVVSWSPVEGASRYKLEVLSAKGQLLSSREVASPPLKLDRASVPSGSLVTVEGFSPLGDKLATFGPVPVD